MQVRNDPGKIYPRLKLRFRQFISLNLIVAEPITACFK
jgi:hypothetical protein